MSLEYWKKRWESQKIGFHQLTENPLLTSYFNALNLTKFDRLFVPLCGKTKDIAWLLDQGYRVVGVEYSNLAVDQLFEELGVTAQIKKNDLFKHYSESQIDVFVGDFFSLTAEMLGKVDAIYDRAALVALPQDLRRSYSKHLINITHQARQLLITYEYDQNIMNGPPFCVDDKEIMAHYSPYYDIELCHSQQTAYQLKNTCYSMEELRLLMPKGSQKLS